MNLGLPYQILITPDDEGYGVEVPVLRGCVTHAEKWEDIPAMIHEAIEAWIGGALKYNAPIPEPIITATQTPAVHTSSR